MGTMENDKKARLLEILEKARKKQEQKAEKAKELEKPKEPKKPVVTDVEKFIKDLGVESGSTPVPNYVIYFMYLTCWNVGKVKKLDRISFFKKFSLYFHKQRIGKRRSYYLDKDSLGVSRDLQRRAKEYDKQLLEKQKKERTKKRKQKIPLPTEGEES